MIRNFKNFVVKENKVYDNALNNILEGLVEIVKNEYLNAEKFGGESWTELYLFKEYIITEFDDVYDIFTESFLKKNYKDIEKIAFEKYGLIANGTKIINFGKTSKEEIIRELFW